MARIYDNIDTKFKEGLEGMMSSTGVERVDFCVGYFNLRGWNMIVNQVDGLTGGYVYEHDDRKYRVCRLLVGMQRPSEDVVRQIYGQNGQVVDSDYAIRSKLQIASDFRKQLLLGLPTKQDECTLRQLSSQLKNGKVCVKLYLKEPLHAKLYLAYRPSDFSSKIIGIMGSSNLTYSGFTGQGELNADFTDSDHVEKLAHWFDDRWEDRFCLDITQELIKVIDESWASEKIIPPYYIYLKTAYLLSEEARLGVKEFTLSPEFRREMFDFQQIAVKIATAHLLNEKRRGAMIGDVVGLGKTITACAIAKIYETTFASSTLVICPPNLKEMWQKYAVKYDLKMEIQSMAKLFDVEKMRYYRLIIIDESHNLRSGSGGLRYNNIKKLIDYQDNNVLLLTATPYNKDISDLINQLRLFVGEDQDIGIRPEAYISKIGGERAFMEKHNETFIRSLGAFEKSDCEEDWNELMKLFLVRRTRTFIEENYAKLDPSNGRRFLQFHDGSRSYFPKRQPISIKFKTIHGDQYSRLYSRDMVDIVESLNLPRYGLANYFEGSVEPLSHIDQDLIVNLARAGARMRGFCKSTIFKRLDSSGFAFLLTLYRHILRNMVFVYAIDNKLRLPINDKNILPNDYQEDDDSPEYDLFNNDDKTISQNGTITFPTDLENYQGIAKHYYNFIEAIDKNVSWLDSRYFNTTLLKRHLLEDCNKILKMMRICGPWKPAEDQKLAELESLLKVKHKDDKVIVFTQYSDTAYYIYKQLVKRGIKHIEIVTGNSENPTSIAERFSPVSNEMGNIGCNELQTLIATDVLSEGQNLQDSHVVVNYDLPWAIIRLIQRAGRVDRIGQKSEIISCYSFFPAEGVEKIIQLRTRLNDRINENAKIIGSDEIFFEGNEQNLRDMFNEKSGILDDDDDTDVDFSSRAYQIWKNATDANPELKRIIPALPDMVYSTKDAESDQQGVITYAKTTGGFDVLTWVAPDGNVLSQSQNRILSAMACNADTPATHPLDNHHELVTQAVKKTAQLSTNNIGGILGNRFSTRYRIIKLLEQAYSNGSIDLFITQETKKTLKLVIDDIYNYRFVESSKTMLGQMLRRSSSNEDIVEQVIELWRAGNLCHIEENDNNREPRIVCSMGLTSTDNNNNTDL